MRQRHRNGKSHKHHPVKKKLADAYVHVQWACLRLVCKRWHGIASLCVVYPKYERKKLVYLAKVAEEANHYEGKLNVILYGLTPIIASNTFAYCIQNS